MKWTPEILGKLYVDGSDNEGLIFWYNEKWKSEEVELIWSDDQTQNIKYLLNSWLTLLDEEKVMQKKLVIHLWFFDIKTGQVLTYCEDEKIYKSLD